MNCGTRAAIVVLALVALTPGAARADFADGLSAYDGGDYETALAEWLALAEAGDAQAQAAIAGLYRYGQGVDRDQARAAGWYLKAARQGEVNAQLNLGDMYASGAGVGRDLVRAYLWLSLAAAEGRAWAARRRDEVAPLMSAAEVAQARALVEAWTPAAE